MALNVLCDERLSQPSCASQVAENLFSDNEPEDMSSKIYESISNNILQCEYFDLNETNKMYTSKNNSLNILHLNIRSLNKNYDKLYDFLQSLLYLPDIVCLSESRIKKQPLVNINIPGYSFVNVAPLRNAGGVAMYVKNGLKYTNDQTFDLHGCESLWLTIHQPNTKKVITIATIYRHPGESVDKFIEDFSICLDKLTSAKRTFYILGDINININENDSSTPTKKYINTINSNGAHSIITKPTRVTASSATLIDHIITNDIAHTVVPSVLLSDLSDHYPVSCTIKQFKTFNKSLNNNVRYYRERKNFCPETFCNEMKSSLSQLKSDSLPLHGENFNATFDSFVETVSRIINKHAPIKRLSRKQKTLAKKPWITNGILTSIRKKNALFRPMFINGSEAEKKYFKRYSNKLTKLKMFSKQMYFHKELKKYEHNPRKTWQIIRSTLPNKSCSGFPNSIRKNNTTTIDNPTTITNEFNDYFCSIGSNLASKALGKTKKKPYEFLIKKISTSIYLEPPSLNEILNQISSLNDHKAVGHDDIPAYFLKVSNSVITPFLQIFTTFMFNNGLFPNNCKIAKVAPIYKTGSKEEVNNYRPISILTCFSKIIEKIMYNRLMTFFIKHKILYPYQFSFQSKISTSHAMLDLITASYDNIDNNVHTGLVFIDFKKAFDTVCHKILLTKLAHYGIRGVAYKLLSSYLSGRKQYVNCKQTKSDLKDIEYGVPQGSSLGPLLFLIYINDLPNSVKCTPRLFADDTCLIFESHCPFSLQNLINIELKKLDTWCCSNKLTVNPFKSNVVFISPKLTYTTNTNYNITLAGSSIDINTNVNYLGLVIDNKLYFREQIKLLENKISRSVGILNKLKPYFSQRTLLQLYHSLVHSHLTYGISVWGSTHKTYLQKIQYLQNRALKIVCNVPYRSSAKPLFRQLNILTIQDTFKLEVAKFVYNCNKRLSPTPFFNFFKRTDQISVRHTRLSNNKDSLYIPKYRSNRLQRCIKYQGVKIWNNIPTDIKKLSFNSFKSKFKDYLVSQY